MAVNKDQPTIEAPVVSFLSKEEAEWVRFLNLREWREKEGETSYVEAVDHLLVLLHRFLDSVPKESVERLSAFTEIAEEISGNLKLRGPDDRAEPAIFPRLSLDRSCTRVRSKAFSLCEHTRSRRDVRKSRQVSFWRFCWKIGALSLLQRSVFFARRQQTYLLSGNGSQGKA